MMPVKEKKRVAIIGAGVVGTALGYLLKRGGYRIAGIGSRTLRSAKRAREFIGEGTASTNLAGIAGRADIVFITTSDRAIEDTCKKIVLKGGFHKGSLVFHTCGALSSAVLRHARKNGASVASLHPLQSLANVQEATKNLRGSYFSLEGDPTAVAEGRKILKTLKGRELSLDARTKSLYHAGAVVSSNFLVATIGFALELFETSGIMRDDALRALLPLIKGTVKNLEKLGIPNALTGPVSRGDIGVVKNHLRILSKEKPALLNLYKELCSYTVGLGIGKGTLKVPAAKKIVSLLHREYI
jgi:predicted short-subunit dehydrogenase-like oxidoreductase (DUF2520 family)